MIQKVARGFATWKIRHGRFATKKICHTTNVTENLSVSIGQTFVTVPMWKIRHTTALDWSRGGWVVRVRGVGSGDWGWGFLTPQPQLTSLTPLQPQTPDLNPPNPNPLDQPTPTYHRCVANLPHRHCCKRFSDAYAQILGHICMSHPLCGESSLWQIFCGESSMWRILWQPYKRASLEGTIPS